MLSIKQVAFAVIIDFHWGILIGNKKIALHEFLMVDTT